MSLPGYILARIRAFLNGTPPVAPALELAAPVDPLEASGLAAAHEAERLWRMDIVDPPRGRKGAEADRWRKTIDAMIRHGLGWTWEPPYRADGDYAWCGAYAATSWSAAIPLATRKRYWSSTYRLDRWARYQSIDDQPADPSPDGPGRICVELDQYSQKIVLPDGSHPRPGDLLLVGDGRPAYGDHITVIERYDPVTRTAHTLEGNGGGLGPDGKPRQGVVRARRMVGLRPGQSPNTYHARRLIRPGPDDLAGATVASFLDPKGRGVPT